MNTKTASFTAGCSCASNPRITVFPATRNRYTAAPLASEQKRKVAAYARVSTDSEEQKNSYNAQISYYTNQIKSRPSWEFVGVYTDEGITGTKAEVSDAILDFCVKRT